MFMPQTNYTIPPQKNQNKKTKPQIIKKSFLIELSSHLLFMSKVRIIYLYLN